MANKRKHEELNCTESCVSIECGLIGGIPLAVWDSPAAADLPTVGISGFGRIGRLVVRSCFTDAAPRIRIAAINAPDKDAEYLAYLFKYDSVHGLWKGECRASDDGKCLIINGTSIILLNSRDPAKLDWAAAGATYVCESTGQFLTTAKCQGHLTAGAKRVIISAPAKDDTPTFVMGVNHLEFDAAPAAVVSMASCTTNCLAPIAKLIHDNFGIAEGLMTTIHSATASQVTVDGTSKKDWRAGRAAGTNLIPSSTGAAIAVTKVIPSLQGKLTGMAVRVPTVDVSMVDLTCKLEKPASVEAIEEALALTGGLGGVIRATHDKVVSQDFVGERCSSVLDAEASIFLNPTFCKIIAWYDNEFGYASRIVDLMVHMAKVDAK